MRHISLHKKVWGHEVCATHFYHATTSCRGQSSIRVRVRSVCIEAYISCTGCVLAVMYRYHRRMLDTTCQTVWRVFRVNDVLCGPSTSAILCAHSVYAPLFSYVASRFDHCDAAFIVSSFVSHALPPFVPYAQSRTRLLKCSHLVTNCTVR